MNKLNIDELTIWQQNALRRPRGIGEKPDLSLGWSHRDIVQGKQIGTFRTSLIIQMVEGKPCWVATGAYLNRKRKAVRPRDRARQGMFKKTAHQLEGVGDGEVEEVIIDGGRIIQYQSSMTTDERGHLYQNNPNWKPDVDEAMSGKPEANPWLPRRS